MESLVTSLVTGFTTTATSMMDAIGKIVPVALPVCGAVMVVGIGIKIFKKLA